MFNFKTFVQQALLAATLAFGIGNASAMPTYHVSIDTTRYAGVGEINLWMSAFDGASGAVATLSNFTGSFGAETARFGDVVGALPGTTIFKNTATVSEVYNSVTLGGILGFDVSFTGEFLNVPGFETMFGVTMYDATGAYLLQGSNLEFALHTPGPEAPGGVTYIKDRIVTVSVPEPSDLLLVMTGLGLVALVRRRGTKAPR